ncbi:MAG: glycoside hydrolase family 15 protein, partial [Pseudomonadota bacterium]
MKLGVIGNGMVSALINGRGDLVWYCFPRFDSDPVFCSLVNGDPQRPDANGTFAVELDALASTEQSYVRNTAVLRTEQRDHQGAALEILDFCPRFRHYGRYFHPSTVIRLLRPLRGDPQVRIRLRPMSHYGAERCEVTHGTNHLRFVGSPGGVIRATTNASITALLEEKAFVLDRPIALVLTPDESLRESPLEVAEQFLHNTIDYWHGWVRNLSIPFEWQEEVIRAAITLNLSVFRDTGAIIAAPTTSLPEAAHMARNWDYRLCWLRDSYFVVRALNRLGATNAMEDFLRYITNLVADIGGGEGGGMQPVYGINGDAELDEVEVPHLRGYRCMGPVRVGNQAYEQRQHDVYGAVVMALTQLMFDARITTVHADALLPRLERVGELAVAYFEQPDAGIWELRGKAREHTYSSLMCWAACDRLARIAVRLGDSERAARWQREAARMHETILARAWCDERNSFVASFEGSTLDASLLLMFELGFLPPNDPRMLGTLAAVERELLFDGFVYRYVEADDFGEPENAFVVCTFWLVDALAMVGRHEEARA